MSGQNAMGLSSAQSALPGLQARLQQRAEDLRAELRAARGSAVPPAAAGSEVEDLKDRATQSAADRVHDAEEQRDLSELAQVEAALARIEAGSFGDCVDCGEPIAASRLAVMPAAECCAACQARRERHGAGAERRPG